MSQRITDFLWPAGFSKAGCENFDFAHLTFGFQGPTEQWRGRRWIGTAPVDRFVRRLDFLSSTELSVIVAVASRKPAITTTSLPFTRTAHTCQVSRNRLHHHLPVPADRRTRRSPLPARPSPRRRRWQRADRSGSAPWRSTRTTDPITHRRVSSLPAFRCIGWLEREKGFTRKPGKFSLLPVVCCMWCTSLRALGAKRTLLISLNGTQLNAYPA